MRGAQLCSLRPSLHPQGQRHPRQHWYCSSCLLCSEVPPLPDQLCWTLPLQLLWPVPPDVWQLSRGVSSDGDCPAAAVIALSTDKCRAELQSRNQFFVISSSETFSLECVRGRMGERHFYLSAFVSFHGTSHPSLPQLNQWVCTF